MRLAFLPLSLPRAAITQQAAEAKTELRVFKLEELAPQDKEALLLRPRIDFSSIFKTVRDTRTPFSPIHTNVQEQRSPRFMIVKGQRHSHHSRQQDIIDPFRLMVQHCPYTNFPHIVRTPAVRTALSGLV